MVSRGTEQLGVHPHDWDDRLLRGEALWSVGRMIDERARREAGKATLSLRLLETRVLTLEKQMEALTASHEALVASFRRWAAQKFTEKN